MKELTIFVSDDFVTITVELVGKGRTMAEAWENITLQFKAITRKMTEEVK